MRLALVGYGKMGRAVEEAAEAAGHEVVARIDAGDPLDAEALSGADVAVEFSHPDAAVDNIRRIAGAGVDAVVGTTGWYDDMEEVRRIVEDAGTGLVWAPNFSLGVQLFFRLVGRLGTLVNVLEEYDLHVHETHHRHKVDHPSGTARRIADLLVATVGRKDHWEPGPPEGAPDPDVLQVTSSRVGEVPGTHVVGVEGPGDRIELRHEAGGRGGFARGAVAAAEWVKGRPGVHSLDAMLAERFGD